MRRLAEDSRVVFVGQSVAYDGATIYDSLDGVPLSARFEMPVIEDFQMGFCIGLALRGFVPVSIYPRFDFLLLAFNQLVNHLDKTSYFGWDAKVIIRTRVGGTRPLNAGPQHTQNHTKALDMMLEHIPVHEVTTAKEVLTAYRSAQEGSTSCVIVENPS